MNEESLVSRYGGPSQTQEVRVQTVQQTLNIFHDLLTKSAYRTDLSDVDAVRTCAEDYLRRCQVAGKPPSIEGLCLALGMSRANFYKFCSRHADSESVQFLDVLRNGINSIRISLCDQGVISPVSLIFLLKNCNDGYMDRTELSTAVTESPLSGMDAEGARRRILEALPEDDDE